MRPLQWGYCNKAIDFGYGYKALAKKALALMQQKKRIEYGHLVTITSERAYSYANLE